jgi:hypothetical protein
LCPSHSSTRIILLPSGSWVTFCWFTRRDKLPYPFIFCGKQHTWSEFEINQLRNHTV